MSLNNNNISLQERRERDWKRRELKAKFFYDVAKLVIAGLVIQVFVRVNELGGDLSAFLEPQNWPMIAMGLAVAALLFSIANSFLRK